MAVSLVQWASPSSVLNHFRGSSVPVHEAEHRATRVARNLDPTHSWNQGGQVGAEPHFAQLTEIRVSPNERRRHHAPNRTISR